MPITESTRLCATCRAILPAAPAPPVCERCGRAHVPLFSEWHPTARLFLPACYTSRHAFLTWDSDQAAAEKLLRVTFNYAGNGKYGHPFGGIGITAETSAVELYAVVVKLAAHWRSLGAPLTHDLLELVGRSAGLIPSSFPTQRAG